MWGVFCSQKEAIRSIHLGNLDKSIMSDLSNRFVNSIIVLCMTSCLFSDHLHIILRKGSNFLSIPSGLSIL